MNNAFPEDLRLQLNRTGVIAVLMIDRVEDAVPLARALLAGGVDCIELTLRTDAALESLRRIRAEVPEMTVGVGTILTPKQANDAKEAGASFGVAPGMNPRVVAEAQRIGLPFAPGVCTPTDIELALEAGCKVLKFFPSEPSGGLIYLRSIVAPFAHLGVQFIPLGGVSAANAANYLKEPSVLALGGSWLAPKDLIIRSGWQAITTLAREASDIVKQVRP
ncbi:bifunctional 4-hydroxy-2-oxoglutarate aldolase/2-dehydro-3-deoxy-phosphogluconate aldolase [Prosthecobacter sp.]|uniref:bifunctional 4-hydroxy-2-oxoglutarate aldolase/2-dehydro-3-deoxy-phosphogluconate aldolase n=1 Tax=Prosthecobacter sp. TaxID=1965333 RepID=UPI002AB9DFAC|nr:bifunctional 4-hydroxy-2-oxoglutarate aldolase/2-dehydro-3-deoxy-phosphogluconate aldolase [Prosthecobacter sp.]MDZ4402771.1 bifunctional 4-hydroxy-2-oxoglutarate aldolase/2-dehydro-3-deoxy-phosphogluconate aldolase [Prosthecobacter sp.]